MEHDRPERERTGFHLTVQLCVVSSRMHDIRRSWRKRVMVLIRRWIIRLVLFIISILTRND